MNRQSLVAKMLHLQVASALVCILLYLRSCLPRERG